MRVDECQIIRDLGSLGVERGDVLYITANLLNVGFFKKKKSETLEKWIDILLEIVGEEGTVIVNAYTDVFFKYKKNKNVIFHSEAIPNSGPLSEAFVKDKRSIRSKHPTHSCVGIGKNIEEIFRGHDETAMSYSVIGQMIKHGCKFLMLGTVDKFNAPHALHYVQEYLGYTVKHPYGGMFQTYYKDGEGELKLFTLNDTGGCTRGAYNLYGTLVVNDAIRFGYVGNAKSALMDGEKSFHVIKEIMQKNKKIILCDDAFCTSCHGNWNNLGIKVIWFYLYKYFIFKIFKFLKRQ